MKAQSERPDISEMPPYRLGRHWNTISHSGKRLRWIVCQWRPSLYLPPFSLLSSMFSPRQSAPCANWNISVSKSTRSTRSTRPSKKVLQLPPTLMFCSSRTRFNGVNLASRSRQSRQGGLTRNRLFGGLQAKWRQGALTPFDVILTRLTCARP